MALLVQRTFLGIIYLAAIGYALALALPAFECTRRHCYGPDYDIFMIPFLLTPIGATATAIALAHAYNRIKEKKPWSWILWPFAVVFGIVMLVVLYYLGLIVLDKIVHR